MLVSASYVGNHGTRLPSNAATLGLLDNMNNPSVLSLGQAVLGALCDGVTCPDGVKIPYLGFTGDIAQALRPWPQFTNLNVRSVPYGYSIYNAFMVKLDKRFSGGLFGRIAYTNSKLINSGAEDVLAGDDPGIQNPLLGSKDDSRSKPRRHSAIADYSVVLRTAVRQGEEVQPDRTGECDCRRLDDRGYTALRLGTSAGYYDGLRLLQLHLQQLEAAE